LVVLLWVKELDVVCSYCADGTVRPVQHSIITTSVIGCTWIGAVEFWWLPVAEKLPCNYVLVRLSLGGRRRPSAPPPGEWDRNFAGR